MTDTYGQNMKLGVGFQSIVGTYNANSMFWIPNISESLTLTREIHNEANARGTFDPGRLYTLGNELSGVENDQHESYLAETSLAGYTERVIGWWA